MTTRPRAFVMFVLAVSVISAWVQPEQRAAAGTQVRGTSSAGPRTVAITGTVRFEDGRPARGARVFALDRRDGVYADEHGAFTLPWPLARHDESEAEYVARVSGTVLHAAHPEGGLVRAVDFGARLVAVLPEPLAPIDFRLPGAHARILGRLVDDEGNGAADWEVWLVDPTWSGARHTDAVAESVFTRSSAGGGFVLRELDPTKSYRIAVRPPVKSRALIAGPFEPSLAPVEIRIGDSVFFDDVLGVAVTPEGRPLAGMTLALRTPLMELRGEGFSSLKFHDWSETTTDASGRFRFARAPIQGAQVFGKDTEAQVFDPTPAHLDPTATDIALVLTPLVPFRVEVPLPPHRYDAILVLDEHGEPLDVHMYGSRAERYDFGVNFENFPDPILFVHPRGRTVVLQRLAHAAGFDTREIARAPLSRWDGPGSPPLVIRLRRE